MSQPSPPASMGDQDKGPTVEAVTWVFTSLALITVFLRLLVRFKITRNPGWDDFWIAFGMVKEWHGKLVRNSRWLNLGQAFNLTYTILIVVAVNVGNGRHMYYLGPESVSNAVRWNTIAFVPGIMSFSVPKLGVAILLMRLLNPSKAQRFVMYFLTISCIIGSILCAAFLWQECHPPEKRWHPAIDGKCWQRSIRINHATFVGGESSPRTRVDCLLIEI